MRPETSAAEPFLRALILATLEEELGAASWPESLRVPLLESQYRVRRQAGQIGAGQLVLVDGAAAGWICVADLGAEVRIVELMIAGEHRDKGVGSAAVREVIAAAGDRPVRLRVNMTNPRAVRFYERLGFRLGRRRGAARDGALRRGRMTGARPAWGAAARHFGLDLTAGQVEHMRDLAGFDAKSPGKLWATAPDRR